MNIDASNHSPLIVRDAWYVVWSEARAEKKVAERLVSRGCDVWLPTFTERRRWSDRWKTVTMPLFTGYLFASTRGAGYVPLLRTPGVLTLVKEGREPAQLEASYIAALRRLVDHPELAVEPAVRECFEPGDEILVREGPLAGYRGQVVQLRGARRLAIWIDSIGQGILCTLGDADVVRAGVAA